jgi:hypothetical protein
MDFIFRDFSLVSLDATFPCAGERTFFARDRGQSMSVRAKSHGVS